MGVEKTLEESFQGSRAELAMDAIMPVFEVYKMQLLNEIVQRFNAGDKEFVKQAAELAALDRIYGDLKMRVTRGNKARKVLSDGHAN